MISRKHGLLIVILIVDIVLAILPIYDTYNVSTWIREGLAFQRSFPAYQGSLNPAGFFISIITLPVSLAYSFFQSIYISALMLKLVLLIFFLMFAYLMYCFLRFYSVNIRIRNFIMLMILLNPGILFVTFIWAEIDIIPVFFVTLSYYFFIARPISRRIFNELFSSISLIISIFFFLYPLVLLPTYIIFSHNKKERIIYFSLLSILGLIFEYVQIKLFQGYVYNYIGAFSGSVSSLAPSNLSSGLFNYIHLYGTNGAIVELTLIGIISIIIPLYLRHLNYNSSIVLYCISALFIFIVKTVNMDNFLFILPFVFLVGINKKDVLYSKVKFIMVNSLLYVPIIFAPFIYSYQNVYGLFYWFFPMIHFNGPTISEIFVNNFVLPTYNLVFLILITISIIIALINPKTLLKNSGKIYNNNSVSNKIKRFNSKKILAVLIFLILISIPFSLLYNSSDNSLYINHPNNFPLLYFYPESRQNSSLYLPINSDSYHVHNDNVCVPSSTPSLLLQRNLSKQYFSLNTTLIMKGNLSGSIAFSNFWSLQENSKFKSAFLEKLKPSTVNVTSSANITIPLLSNITKAYKFNYGSSVCYNVSLNNIQNDKLLWIFNTLNISSSQADPFYVIVGNNILELALYHNYAVIANYTKSQGWEQSIPIPVPRSPFTENNWNYVTLNAKQGKLSLTFRGITYSTLFPDSKTNIKLKMGSPFGSSFNAFSGIGTSVYSFNKSINPFINQLLINYNGTNEPITDVKTNTTKIEVQLISANNETNLKVDGKDFNMEASKFLIIGKDGGIGSLDMQVNELRISYLNKINFFLIPVFLVFYLPILFSISSVVFIRKQTISKM